MVRSKESSVDSQPFWFYVAMVVAGKPASRTATLTTLDHFMTNPECGRQAPGTAQFAKVAAAPLTEAGLVVNSADAFMISNMIARENSLDEEQSRKE